MQITNIEKNFLDFLFTEDVFIPLEIYQWKDQNLSGFRKRSKLGVTFFYVSGSCKFTGSFSPLLVKNGTVVWVMAFTGHRTESSSTCGTENALEVPGTWWGWASTPPPPPPPRRCRAGRRTGRREERQTAPGRGGVCTHLRMKYMSYVF